MYRKTASALLLALLLAVNNPPPTHAAVLTGALEEAQGLPLLKLWGSHYDKGYAHGFLLAEDITLLLDNYMLGTLYDQDNYWRTTVLVRRFVRLPYRFRRELQGMFDGIVAAIGRDGFYSTILGRPFTVDDLVAWNMAPEIFRLSFPSDSGFQVAPQFCSSLAAWGEASDEGDLIVARNLDFGYPGDLIDRFSIVVSYRSPGTDRDVVSVTWPGIIGCLTCMNEDGEGAVLDFGNNEPALEQLLFLFGGIYAGIPKYYTPVLLALRQTLERPVRPWLRRDPAGSFFSRLRWLHFAGSFDILLFSPARSFWQRDGYPASVLECNHMRSVLRTPEDNDSHEPVLENAEMLTVTNHHRTLSPPEPCPRYEILVDRLNDCETLDLDAALDIARSVAQDDGPFHTVHLVGFNADRKQVRVSFADETQGAAEAATVFFLWGDLF